MTNEQSDALITALNNVVAALKALRPGLNAILDLVGENNELLRGECAARERIEKKRKADRVRLREKRGKDVARHDKVKGEENEKRNLPPTPPIKSKEKEEENCVSIARARKETLSEKRERVTETGFPEFWAAYPGFRKTKKTKTKQAFHARMLETKDPDGLFGQMMKALEKWKLTRLWTKDGGDYIMAPKVWLNNESWLDENIPPPMTEDGVDKARSEQRFVPSRKPQTNIVLAPTEAELASARDAI